jgi:hypothetical protein
VSSQSGIAYMAMRDMSAYEETLCRNGREFLLLCAAILAPVWLYVEHQKMAHAKSLCNGMRIGKYAGIL